MNIRNVAIIAHVDHGKTTLVDALLRQSDTRLGKEMAETTLIMDSNPLERERGITIFSKNASVRWRDTKINIIDTPGHADFGGEVERVLTLADGCLLLVDAKEGPMPQTRFVLKKALERKLAIIVVINKIDKPGARLEWVHDKTLELFLELGATDEIADFPVLYAIAKQGTAATTPDLASQQDITPIFEAILAHVPAPHGDSSRPLQFLATTITGDSFRGRVATGRIANGTINAGQTVAHLRRDGSLTSGRLTALMGFEGLGRVDIEKASAGDIVAIAGFPDIQIGETLADLEHPEALPLLSIEEPTVRMTFMVNDSPFAGREGTYSTSRQVGERLVKELETDTALRVEPGATPTEWIVSGRGELHLAILIERLRREGYEFQVGRPRVITKTIDGVLCVPYERASVEVPDAFAGAVIEKLGARNGTLATMESVDGITFLEFDVPTRGLFGYRSQFLTDTKGLGIMHTAFTAFRPDRASWKERSNGSLVASETGQTLAYGLLNVQDRGVFFIGPGVTVYQGQIVGAHSRSEDLRVNVCKAKQLSNVRSKGEGVSDNLVPPREMGLEAALGYIGDDELVEVTPAAIRLRKIILDEAEARRLARGIRS